MRVSSTIDKTITEIRAEKINRRHEKVNFNELVERICRKNKISEKHIRKVGKWDEDQLT